MFLFGIFICVCLKLLGVLNIRYKFKGEFLVYVKYFRDVWFRMICDQFILGICILKKNIVNVGKYFI